MEDGSFGARVTEVDAPQLHGRGLGRDLGREGRRRDAGRRVENLLDAPRRDRRPGDHHRHERRHHHRHEDLDEIGHEGRQGADLHLTGLDALGAEPEDGHRRDVEDDHHHREGERHEAAHGHGSVGVGAVGGGEPLPLEILAHEGPDHPNAGNLLAQDPVDRVDGGLHGREVRQHAGGDQPNREPKQRDGDGDQPRQARVFTQRHDDAADHHDRSRQHHRERHVDDRLHLGDVICVAGDQCWRTEAGQFARGERPDATEEIGPKVPAEQSGTARRDVGRRDRRRDLDEGHREHHRAGADDEPGVAGNDTLVDDLPVE